MLPRYWLTASVLVSALCALASCAGLSREADTLATGVSPVAVPPPVNSLPPLSGVHTASFPSAYQQKGKDFVAGVGASISGNDATLQPAAGGIAWAMYSWDTVGFPTLDILLTPEIDSQSEVWLAVSNYSTTTWSLHGPFGGEELVDLSAGGFSSPADMFHCCVIAYAPMGSSPGPSKVNLVTLNLDYTPPPIHSISGTLLDGTGQPVVGQDLELSQSGTPLDTVSTDGSGLYTFTEVADGNYMVTPLVDAATDVDPADSLDVAVSGTDVFGIDFEISPYDSLGGTILDDLAQPVAGVEVSLDGGNGGSVMTNVAGQYLFPAGSLFDLSEGDSFDVTPNLSGYTFAPVAIGGTMPAGGISDADFTASSGPPSYTVSGRITDSIGDPVEGVSVSLTGHGSELTDSNGDYSFVGIPDGSYTLTPAVATTPPELDITVAGADYPGCDFVTVGGGGYVISGHVTASGSGDPVPNVDMKLTPGNRHVYTDVNGYYEFDGVADGNYTITPQMILSSPPKRDVSVSGADLADVDFVNTGPPPPG